MSKIEFTGIISCSVHKFYIERWYGRTERVLTTCMGSVWGETVEECLRKARSMLCDHVGTTFVVLGSGGPDGKTYLDETITITREDELTYSRSARIVAGLEKGSI